MQKLGSQVREELRIESTETCERQGHHLGRRVAEARAEERCRLDGILATRRKRAKDRRMALTHILSPKQEGQAHQKKRSDLDVILEHLGHYFAQLEQDFCWRSRRCAFRRIHACRLLRVHLLANLDAVLVLAGGLDSGARVLDCSNNVVGDVDEQSSDLLCRLHLVAELTLVGRGQQSLRDRLVVWRPHKHVDGIVEAPAALIDGAILEIVLQTVLQESTWNCHAVSKTQKRTLTM